MYRLKASHVLLVIVAIACFAAVTWSLGGRGGGQGSAPSDDPESSSHASEQSESPTTGEIVHPPSRKQTTLNKRVKLFAELYYSLSPDDDLAQKRQAVEPYVTQYFLETAIFGFGDSEADQAMIQEGASLVVTTESELIGEFTSSKRAEGVVKLRVAKYDRDGAVVSSFTYDQPMVWVKHKKSWRIYESPHI